MHDLRRATEATLLEAAWRRYASIGPNGTSVREVAQGLGAPIDGNSRFWFALRFEHGAHLTERLGCIGAQVVALLGIN